MAEQTWIDEEAWRAADIDGKLDMLKSRINSLYNRMGGIEHRNSVTAMARDVDIVEIGNLRADVNRIFDALREKDPR